jgi:hypothetical protein
MMRVLLRESAMLSFLSRIRCVAVLGTLLAAASAQAGVSFNVGIGLPIYAPIGPVGAISVGVHGGYRGGYYGGHYGGYRGGYYRGYCCGWGPSAVVVAPWYAPEVVTVVQQPPVVEVRPAPVALPPAPPSRPDPVIYPRSGQSPQQTEADRQECNRWATTQPSAMAEASVFQRAVEACMDGRGYTLR